MTPRRARCSPKEPTPAPGDDQVPVPKPVDEDPPLDSFCDLVLTGGVASGVVYPWAIVELARKYRFRNIGGTSVGAMAAALAAAAEYGRRTGFEAPFEVLRRAPASLAAKQRDGRTRMLSLFQPAHAGRRLLQIWGEVGCGHRIVPEGPQRRCPPRGIVVRAFGVWTQAYGKHIWGSLRVFVEAFLGALVLAILGAGQGWVIGLMMLSGSAFSLALILPVWATLSDIRRGLIANNYGLCKGAKLCSKEADDTPGGLSDWLHDGIQRSAGLKVDDRPLTFRDLWNAPAYPGAERGCCGPENPAEDRSINLQMITTNATTGQPVRLPLAAGTSRLFFRRCELEGYFPPCVLDALVEASKPYAQSNDSAPEPPATAARAEGLLQLPDADLPLVVAARLSLSFPLLFSAVPLHAIDTEAPVKARTLAKCWFTDGGASSNFPIHLFDAAIPRWPTFGLWLDQRSPYHRKDREDSQIEQEVWLPKSIVDGPGEHWDRFDPGSLPDPEKQDFWTDCKSPDQPRPLKLWQFLSGTRDSVTQRAGRWKSASRAKAAGLQARATGRPPMTDPDRMAGHRSAASATASTNPQAQNFLAQGQSLFGFLGAVATSAANWRDRANFLLPHVRNRVVRLLLLPGEGGMHIGMPGWQILQMAHRYGTVAGLKLVKRFEDVDGQPSPAWTEQRWIRMNLLVNGLRERLDGLASRIAWETNAVPLRQAIDRAKRRGPVAGLPHNPTIDDAMAQGLKNVLRELEQLDTVLQAAPKAFEYRPEPELRLRPPL